MYFAGIRFKPLTPDRNGGNGIGDGNKDGECEFHFFTGSGKEERRRYQPLLSVSEMYGGLPDCTLYGYSTQHYHSDDPDGDETRGSRKQRHLVLRLLPDLRHPLPE